MFIEQFKYCPTCKQQMPVFPIEYEPNLCHNFTNKFYDWLRERFVKEVLNDSNFINGDNHNFIK